MQLCPDSTGKYKHSLHIKKHIHYICRQIICCNMEYFSEVL